MRKLILMLWVIILPITFSFGQTKQDSTNIYNRLNDWAVVKLTIAYIEDYRTNFAKSENGIDIKESRKKEYETYKVLVEKYNNYSDDVNLNEVSKLLKEGDWEGAHSRVFLKYEEELINNSKQIISFNDVSFSPKTSGTSRKKALINILEEYNELLVAYKTEKDKSLVSDTPSDPKQKKEDESTSLNTQGEGDELSTANNNVETTKENNYLVYGLIVLLFLSLIVIIFLIKKKNNIEEGKDYYKQKFNALDKSNNQENFNSKLSDLRKEIKTLEDKNSKLKKDILDLQNISKTTVNQNTVSSVDLKTQDSISETITLDLKEQPTNNNIVYLPSPFKELTFANEDASSQYEINSIYRVELSNENTLGKLFIIEDADFSRALNSPDSFLKTVCIYENEFSNNARVIKNIEAGEIILEGEDWTVTKKVRIKFI